MTPRKLKPITIIKRLYAAVNDRGSGDVLAAQVKRVQERSTYGIDAEGKSLSPKSPRKAKAPQPSGGQFGSRLYDNVKFSSTRTIGGFDVSANVTGEAARIAKYQGVRKFGGFSEADGRAVRSDFISRLIQVGKRWR